MKNPGAGPGLDGYRADIDGLRAVAVVSVILYHAGVRLFSGGFVGVDIFFVISGYLITNILCKDLRAGKFSIVTFYERRLRRILPPLVFMSAAVTAACWFCLLPDEFKNFGRSLAAMATFWANVLFYKQSGYFDAVAESKPLLHTWSLSVEEQFYIFLPLILLIIFKKMRWPSIFHIPYSIFHIPYSIFHIPYSIFRPCILAFLAFISLLSSIIYISKSPDAVFYLLHFRAWELLSGSLLAVWPPTRLRIPDNGLVPNCLSAVALLLLFMPVGLYSPATVFPGFTALAPVAGAALFIQLGSRGFGGRILATSIPVFIGKISYPLYLWHWPLLVIPELLRSRPLTPRETIISLSAAAVLSIFSWRVIENPIRAKRVLASRKTLFAVSLACIVALTASGRLIKSMDGWPSRLSPELMAYLNEAESFKKDSRACLRDDSSTDFTPCLIGKAGGSQPSFLLWGDSHAAAWLPGLREMAEDYGETGLQYTMSSCAPLVGFTMDYFSEPLRAACLRFNSDIGAVIEQNGIKHIVLAATFGAYLAGHHGKAGESLGKPLDEAFFKKSLAETVDKLHQLGVTVWLVQDVPEYDYPVPQSLARILLSGGQAEDIALQYQDYTVFSRPLEQALRELPADAVRELAISPPICDTARCLPGDEYGAYYSDAHHLSTFGSKHFTHTFTPLFEAIRSENTIR